MLTIDMIKQEEKEWILKNSEKISEIKQQKNNEDFFVYFLEAVKDNQYFVVNYILNHCFENAEERANFANQKDKLGNTAYHYAASKESNEVIVLFNDKSAFNGKRKFILFGEKNSNGKSPLDLCSELGLYQTFLLIWDRAGKSNHNPSYALRSACKGGNESIIETILSHAKVKEQKQLIQQLMLEFDNEAIKKILQKALEGKNEIEKSKGQAAYGLKQHGYFKDEKRLGKQQKNLVWKSERVSSNLSNIKDY